MSFFSTLFAQGHWLWIGIGVLLCAGEVLTPGVFLLWLGLAMIATGFAVWLTPLVFPWSILLFCALSIVFVLIGRRIYGSVSVSGDQPFLNRRADALVGRSFTLAAPIKGGEGEIVINDTHWKIRGPDMPAGTRIKITGIEDATVLVVEQV